MAEALVERPPFALTPGAGPRLELLDDLCLTQVIARRGRADAVAGHLGMALPGRPGRASAIDRGHAFCLRPGDWLLVRADQDGRRGIFAQTLRQRLADVAAVIDQSHGRIAVRLACPDARAVLQKGLDLDMHASAFPPGAAAQAGLFGIAVLLHCREPDAFEIFVARSFAADLVHLLEAGPKEHQ